MSGFHSLADSALNLDGSEKASLSGSCYTVNIGASDTNNIFHSSIAFKIRNSGYVAIICSSSLIIFSGRSCDTKRQLGMQDIVTAHDDLIYLVHNFDHAKFDILEKLNADAALVQDESKLRREPVSRSTKN